MEQTHAYEVTAFDAGAGNPPGAVRLRCLTHATERPAMPDRIPALIAAHEHGTAQANLWPATDARRRMAILARTVGRGWLALPEPYEAPSPATADTPAN